MTTFGRLIAEACEQKGVSLYALAKRMRVQQSRVPQIVASRNLTERTLRRAARALGLQVEVRLVGAARGTASGVGRRRARGSSPRRAAK